MNDKYIPTDHFGTALAYLMLGVAGGLSLDLCAKKLLEDYPIEQFVFLRSVFGIVIFLAAARWYGGYGALTVSYTHLTLPTTLNSCRSRWSPYH
mgnify:CR=1 FL=1